MIVVESTPIFAPTSGPGFVTLEYAWTPLASKSYSGEVQMNENQNSPQIANRG